MFISCKTFYDAADSKNASLYIFAEDGAADQAMACVAALEAAGLWTSGELAEVRDDQREAYATQLETIEIISLPAAGCHAGRFEHKKFPSSAGQWQQWKNCLLSN